MRIFDALRAERSAILAQANAILDNPGVTNAEAATATAMLDTADKIKARMQAMERAGTMAATLVSASDNAPAFEQHSASLSGDFASEIRLIRSFALNGMRLVNGMVVESNDPAAEAVKAEMSRRYRSPSAAAGTSPGTAGGYSVAPAFLDEVLVAMKSQGAMRSVADCFTTETGAALTWPEMNDLSQSGRLLTTENTLLNAGTDIPFAAGSFSAYTFVSDILLVSNQLMQDSAFDFGKLLATALGSRLARAENPYFTTGTGAGQPQGVVNGAAAGVVGATGSTVNVTYNSLIDLLHSVDAAYRVNGSYMMHDTTLQYARKLTDTAGQPVIRTFDAPGAKTTTSGGTMFGYPVVVNNDMPVMAANAKSVLFGDFSAYKVRTVVDLRLQILRERFADSFQTGFIASIRSDGRLASAATPIRYYQNSAT